MKRYSSCSMKALAPFRPPDRREQPLPRLVPERLDPACGRSGLPVVAGVEALVLIVDGQRRLAPPPLVEHMFRAGTGEVPCVEVSSRERAGPAVARGERAVGQEAGSPGKAGGANPPPRTTKGDVGVIAS